MSFNKVERNRKWSENQAFGFEVWSDQQRELAQQLGAADTSTQGSPKRVTRVLDGEGRVVLAYDEVQVGAHPQAVLEDVQAWLKSSR